MWAGGRDGEGALVFVLARKTRQAPHSKPQPCTWMQKSARFLHVTTIGFPNLWKRASRLRSYRSPSRSSAGRQHQHSRALMTTSCPSRHGASGKPDTTGWEPADIDQCLTANRSLALGCKKALFFWLHDIVVAAASRECCVWAALRKREALAALHPPPRLPHGALRAGRLAAAPHCLIHAPAPSCLPHSRPRPRTMGRVFMCRVFSHAGWTCRSASSSTGSGR